MNLVRVTITSILLLVFASGVAWAGERADGKADARLARIKAFAEEAASQVPGMAVITAFQDHVIFRNAYGFSDLEHRVALRPEDPFRIGSLTKQFTAVAILQLAHQGKLGLEDDVRKYVPDCPAGAARVTLSHLLTHTSGIPNYTDVPGWDDLARQDRTPGQLLSLVHDKPLQFRPGTDWNYSNTNYVILGMVIEKVTGESYAAYLKSHVFAPAGMSCTRYDDAGAIMPHRVRGYTGSAQRWRNADFVSASAAYAAGGLISNVDDLWKWEHSLTNATLIPHEWLARARREQHLEDGRGTGYGFGWAVGTLDGHSTAEHGGRIPGFQSYTVRISDAGIFVAVLFNTDDESAKPSRLALRIARTLIDDATPSLPTTSADVRPYVGTYLGPKGATMTFAQNKNTLILQEDGRAIPLTRVRAGEFVSRRDVRQFKFETDKPENLLVHPRLGVEQRFTRPRSAAGP